MLSVGGWFLHKIKPLCDSILQVGTCQILSLAENPNGAECGNLKFTLEAISKLCSLWSILGIRRKEIFKVCLVGTLDLYVS